MLDESSRGPGRPRDEQVAGKVIRAAVREISEYGLRSFSIARVSERANVARGTVYLRWPNREGLLLDALRSTGEPLDVVLTEDLQTNIQNLVQAWAEIFEDPITLGIFTHLEADRAMFPSLVDEYYAHIAHPYNIRVEEMLNAARIRGDVRSDVDTRAIARMLVGALYLESRFRRQGFTSDFKHGLVDAIFVAVATKQASSS